ncbi:MAG: hypothetical protein K0S55_1165 [Clostridia bacterium]|nr:hypothetical protein [Clostridia bacterium]
MFTLRRSSNFMNGMIVGMVAGGLTGMVAIYASDKDKRKEFKKTADKASHMIQAFLNDF